MPHQVGLQLDRGDPLAARLDDVLRAVGDGQVPVRADRADITGPQPAVAELRRVRITVVAGRDPGPAHLQLADRLAVVRQHLAVRADQPRLDRGDEPALGQPVGPGLVVADPDRRPGERAER
jgi:hypothetical protein